MPIIFSGFVAVLLNPVADFLERLKFPRGLASLLAVLTGSGVIVGLFIMVLIQSQEIIAEIPQLIQNNSSFLVLSADQFENSIL